MKLSITSVPASFRRAGFAFTREEQTIELDETNDADKIQALKDETMLRVSEVKDETRSEDKLDEGPDGEGKGKGKKSGKN